MASPCTSPTYIITITVRGNTPRKRINLLWKVTVIPTCPIVKALKLKRPCFAGKSTLKIVTMMKRNSRRSSTKVLLITQARHAMKVISKVKKGKSNCLHLNSQK